MIENLKITAYNVGAIRTFSKKMRELLMARHSLGEVGRGLGGLHLLLDDADVLKDVTEIDGKLRDVVFGKEDFELPDVTPGSCFVHYERDSYYSGGLKKTVYHVLEWDKSSEKMVVEEITIYENGSMNAHLAEEGKLHLTCTNMRHIGLLLVANAMTHVSNDTWDELVRNYKKTKELHDKL